jgi:uridine phosphorylase
MAYPKMKGKHSEKPVFSTDDFVKYSKKMGIAPKTRVPESIIICYSRRLLESIRNVHKISELRDVFGNYGRLYGIDGTGGRIGLLADFGIGAPATIMYMEEMLAWGAKKFVILGMAGGISEKLKAGDVVICTKSVRDEGTSHHYVKHSKYAYASRELTQTICQSLGAEFSRLFAGPSWTIDAPYRETVKEFIRYRKEGILTVEMEASALFAVAKYKGVESAAVFVVSDILSERVWKPQFRSRIVMTNLVKAFISIKDVLSASQNSSSAKRSS